MAVPHREHYTSVVKLFQLMMVAKIIVVCRVHKTKIDSAPCHVRPSVRIEWVVSHRTHFRNFLFWIFTKNYHHVSMLVRMGNLRTFTAISSHHWFLWLI
jgi:hypothetical protein